ncbi:hypothetical protein P5G65_29080 [Paenibacillus chondroitinus]|uniref:Uncharacterized protein n=1 Tax=Paenibacillus chondroitinus TaxID=59842 RepID=A0ABU6DK10_9BACL|nr:MULTISPECIES: hypothetical protein [Paenibacillus]MCY9660977.1 hypothetical protein [Paenibacillus anseongense]MEB4797964.1 hypothetical protein [Paenibacillus chondroitinus]
MQEVQTKYEQALQEEDTLTQRISLCKEFIDIILEYISHKADSIHILTAEEIVTAVHTIGQDLETELLHLRLEKRMLENKLRLKGLGVQHD